MDHPGLENADKVKEACFLQRTWTATNGKQEKKNIVTWLI